MYDGLDESFHDAILMTCVSYIPLPFEIKGEISGIKHPESWECSSSA